MGGRPAGDATIQCGGDARREYATIDSSILYFQDIILVNLRQEPVLFAHEDYDMTPYSPRHQDNLEECIFTSITKRFDTPDYECDIRKEVGTPEYECDIRAAFDLPYNRSIYWYIVRLHSSRVATRHSSRTPHFD